MKANQALEMFQHGRQSANGEPIAKAALRRARNGARVLRAHGLAKLRGDNLLDTVRREYGANKAVRAHFNKADIEGHSTVENEPGSELLGGSQAAAQFTVAAFAYSALDAIGVTEVPANVIMSGLDGEPIAFLVAEGRGIPLSEGDWTARFQLQPLKIGAMMVFSRELLEHSLAEAIIARGMPRATAKAIDSVAFSTTLAQSLLNGISPIVSGGSGEEDLIYDINELLDSLTGANAQTVSLVANTKMLQKLALLRNDFGLPMFPGLSVRGGVVAGLPIVPSLGVPDSILVAVDGVEVLRTALPVEFSASSNASLEFSDAPEADAKGPTAPSTTKVVSLFQTDSVALKTVAPTNFRMRKSGCIGYISTLDLDTGITTE